MTQAFNLSQFANKVNTSGQADLATAVTGTLPVANGGTGATTLTSGNVLIGAGTGAVTSVAAGTSGNVLTSNGTTWTSAAAIGGQLQTEIFTAPGTWTKPASCTQVRVAVAGGGGGAGGSSPTTGRLSGGDGGYAYVLVPVSAPVAITIGSAGNGGLNANGTPGSTSSFGSAVSCTGGGGGTSVTGADGVATVSSGTTLSLSNVSGNALLGAGGGSNPGPVGLAYSIPGRVNAGVNGTPRNFPLAGFGGIGGAVAIEYIG